MPNTRQAKKDLRQARKANEKNTAARVALHKVQKEVRLVVEAKDKNKAAELVRKLQQLLDKAAKHNVVHWKTAARKKSRLSAKINAIK